MKFQTAHVRRMAAHGLIASAVIALAGCNMASLVDTRGEPGTIDPKGMQSEDAALLLYNGAIQPFRIGFSGICSGPGCFAVVSGRLSDELVTGAYGTTGTAQMGVDQLAEVDARNIPEDRQLRTASVESWYRYLNLARNQAVDAIHYLRTYAPRQPKDLVGHMFAIRGMTMTFLADIFCSGIPLTDYRSPGGYIYTGGSTTDEVYTAALAQFDSALAHTPDSTTFRHLAQVGKARALLNLGRFAEAAQAVQDVPTSFEYRALYGNGGFSPNWANFIWDYSDPESYFGTVANRKGINGLPYVSANDPRVPTIRAPKQSTTYPTTEYRLPAWMFPKDAVWKGTSSYQKGFQSVVVANGVEARLTEAEAAANAGDASFLAILNTLRTNNSFTTAPNANDASKTDTLWNAGTGKVAGLRPLTDPGNKNARIKMVYDERAYWLFLTGHRQGDLRRLVRVYKWPQDQVYPTGYFPDGRTRSFGTYTNLPIPYTEQAINPQYKGCFNRDA